MRIAVSILLFSLMLSFGCAKKIPVAKTVSRFPDQPAVELAKTAEQGIPAKLHRKGYSVRGGWGYKRENAFILSVPPAKPKQVYNNTVRLESLLIAARNEMEFIVTPPVGKRYAVAEYGTVSRTLAMHAGKMFSVWKGLVTLYSEEAYPAKYRAYVNSQPLQSRSRVAKADAKVVQREYWFNITDTFFNKKNSCHGPRSG